MSGTKSLDEISGALHRVETSLAATRRVARVAAAAALLGWLCFGAIVAYSMTRPPPRVLRVKDDFGNAAILRGTSLYFESAAGKPVAWFTVSPTPHFQMTAHGVPFVDLGISSLNFGELTAPFGTLTLRAENGAERTILPEPRPRP